MLSSGHGGVDGDDAACVSPSSPSVYHALVDNDFGMSTMYRGVLVYTSKGPRLVVGATSVAAAGAAGAASDLYCRDVP